MACFFSQKKQTVVFSCAGAYFRTVFLQQCVDEDRERHSAVCKPTDFEVCHLHLTEAARFLCGFDPFEVIDAQRKGGWF